jgi:hypothetical protein
MDDSIVKFEMPGGYVNGYVVAAAMASGFEPPSLAKPLDVCFVFDTTGSMYKYLDDVRNQLSHLTKQIAKRISGVRIGVMAFGDHCDERKTYLVKTCPLTDNWTKISDWIHTVEGTYGGDEPEALEDALFEANVLNWRFNTARAIVLVGDAPPHGVSDSKSMCPNQRDWEQETRALAHKAVHVYTVQCGGKDDTTKAFRHIAEQTQGIHLNLHDSQDLVDLLIGVCMKEVGQLEEFEEHLAAVAALTDSKEKLFAALMAGNETPVGA